MRSKTTYKVAYAFSCALFYGVCSGSMNFTNKWVLNTWGFNYPNFMEFCQLALFSFVITALRKTGKITDNVCLAYTRERGRQLALLSFLYLTNVILGNLVYDRNKHSQKYNVTLIRFHLKLTS